MLLAILQKILEKWVIEWNLSVIVRKTFHKDVYGKRKLLNRGARIRSFKACVDSAHVPLNITGKVYQVF